MAYRPRAKAPTRRRSTARPSSRSRVGFSGYGRRAVRSTRRSASRSRTGRSGELRIVVQTVGNGDAAAAVNPVVSASMAARSKF